MISLAKNVIFYLPSLLKIIDESETSLLLSFEIRFVLFTTFIMNKLLVERKQKLKMKMHSGLEDIDMSNKLWRIDLFRVNICFSNPWNFKFLTSGKTILWNQCWHKFYLFRILRNKWAFISNKTSTKKRITHSICL